MANPTPIGLPRIPVKVDYTDLIPIMAFFMGDLEGRGAHDYLGERIGTRAGSGPRCIGGTRTCKRPGSLKSGFTDHLKMRRADFLRLDLE
ncbi:BZ3500_MvSof-1268-A1-R1_Chr2-1g04152 [Microbotryum saponariae]|uniref:BZ3500_MvSof-1268-A1-R1_Chr2-1g04152 protein n=1 Tax=Microbotryum saponariae TaxID=289078 RepID=A0A2X0MAE4_9BASI|nr:BZ3500_MvSof-1268-A1-R1_Chr2-1g04152 [Microbotryum saponariae]SCZ91139.1 BZ3501_MvSof-1269-A2-R1_Chr2-1g03808 [Microbotryum saponariae]